MPSTHRTSTIGPWLASVAQPQMPNCFLLEQIKIIETPFMVNCFESTGPRAKADISYTHIANIDSFDPIGIYS